jgi:hypothetical protein
MAEANPRRHNLFEEDHTHVFRWAFKHAEELEAPGPNRYSIESHFVTNGEALCVVVSHRAPEDGRWATTLVHSVQFDPDWELQGSAHVYVVGDTYIFGSSSRSEDGEWFANRFVKWIKLEAGVPQLGKLVREALGRTRLGVLPHQRAREAATDWHNRAICRVACVKTMAQLYDVADFISLRKADEAITMVPSWAYRGRDYQLGYIPLASKAVTTLLQASDEELGKGLIQAKSLCCDEWEAGPDS